MSNPWTLTGSRTLISSPDYAWEGNINEGPEVIRRNGKVFIVYSASHCSSPNYALGMLSMNETADPLNAASWFKHPNPVFQRNDAVMAYGPGHHCFFTSPDGTEDWFAYHATSYSGGVCDEEVTSEWINSKAEIENSITRWSHHLQFSRPGQLMFPHGRAKSISHRMLWQWISRLAYQHPD